MPSRNRPGGGKPWRALAKRSGKMHSLGNYDTREEAVAAEDVFKAQHPPKPKRWPDNARTRSVEVRKVRKVENWRKPEAPPKGDGIESQQQRARLRAVESVH